MSRGLEASASTSDVSQDLDTALLQQALCRRTNLIFGAAQAPRSCPFLEYERPRSVTQIELLNTFTYFFFNKKLSWMT